MNILANALDTLEESIELSNSDFEGTYWSRQGNNSYSRPFFTTKSVGKGTAMGLSISYQIITQRHGGSIKCISQLGEESTWIISIPLHQQVM